MRHAAQVIKDRTSYIMETWEEEVRKEVEASKLTHDLVLLNHLPNVLQSLSDLMFRNDNLDDARKDEVYQEFVANSADHGRHRAASSHYTVDQIIHEYIVFHRVVTDLLVEENVYQQNVVDLLKYGIETAMLKSADAFSVSIQEMQEKLVGTLAHDIRNALTTAQLAILMMEGESKAEEHQKLRAMAAKGIQKTLSLTEGLLDTITVKAGEGIMLHFSEDEIIHHVKWVYKEASEVYSHSLNLTYDNEKITGVFDATAINRVMENLITNAIKYGSKEKPITLQVLDKGDSFKLIVHNHGNPIPKERQKSIFKFLSSGDESDNTSLKSWGIGLTLVKIVAEAHGGNVELISNEEHGTSFIVTIMKNHNKPGKIRTRLNYSGFKK